MEHIDGEARIHKINILMRYFRFIFNEASGHKKLVKHFLNVVV